MVKDNIREKIVQIAKEYAKLLESKLNIKNIYVYGSYINGNYTEDSDIDIAVVADDFSGDPIEDIFILMKIRRKVDIRIEPRPFTSSDFTKDNPLARKIIENGLKIV
ncbi:MAG: nucleotidyltransferase domain-containing protein [Clostridia bacterium]|jgi:predicted nucleotidyltransferase|nr:nucleotidyltransferase domain-containing protein [Clostridia bacterium]